MFEGRSINQYRNFTFEEFLQDEYFLAQWLCSNPAVIAFWKTYHEEILNKDFEQAVSYMDMLHLSQPQISIQEQDNLWEGIQSTVRKVSPVKYFPFRRLTYIAAGIAAVFLLVIGGWWSSQQTDGEGNSHALAAYVALQKKNQNGLVSKHVTLVLSGAEKALFDKKNPNIVYDRDSVFTPTVHKATASLESFNQLITPKGQRSTLVLDDGTKLWVNAGTTVTFPVSFAKDKREIYVDGEVFLDVEHDSKRPFFVHTNGVNVRVLGTRFSVSSYGAKTARVILASGKVQVNAGDKQAFLAPDQMFIKQGDNVRKTVVDAARNTSWINGYYSYETERFGLIIEQLAQYYGVDIQCDPEIAARTFSGKLSLEEDLDKLMKGLAFSVQFTYKQTGNSLRIYKSS